MCVTENIWFMINAAKDQSETTVNAHQNSPSMAEERQLDWSLSLTLFHNNDLRVKKNIY